MKIKPESTNFPLIWDTKTETLVSAISEGIPAGTNILGTHEDFPLACAIMEISFIPTLGGDYSATGANNNLLLTSPVMQGLINLMSQISGSNYTASSFDYSSLGLHCILSGQYWMRFTRILRALRYVGAIDTINRAEGPLLAKALGFQYDKLRLQDVIELRSALLTCVTSLNKLMLPVGIPLVDKWISMVSKIYTDDFHDKTQLYFFDPEICYALTNSSTSISTYLGYKSLLSNADPLSELTALTNEVNDYLLSADFATIIAPKLYRAFLDPNGPRIGSLYEMQETDITNLLASQNIIETAEFVYDESMRDLIRNADFLNIDVNSKHNTSTSGLELLFEPRISIDAAGMLREGFWTTYTNGVAGFTGYGIPILSGFQGKYLPFPNSYTNAKDYVPGGNRIINLSDFPAPKDIVLNSVAGLILCAEIKPFASTVYENTDKVLIIDQSYPVVLVSRTYYYYDSTGVISSYNYGGLLAASGSYSYAFGSLPVPVLQFAASPKIYNRVTSTSVQVTWSDIDNIVQVPETMLQQLFLQSAQFSFRPTWSALPKQDFSIKTKSRSSHNKHKARAKNKEPDIDKSAK